MIADPIREYVEDWREIPRLMEGLDEGDVDGILEDFLNIADRIDRDHERLMKQSKRTAPRKRALIIYGESSMFGCCQCGRWLEVAKKQRFCPECGAELIWRSV
jgi:predicted RNA-binding Zn-ribbon protein involved in translation (DUF1610 family)